MDIIPNELIYIAIDPGEFRQVSFSIVPKVEPAVVKI